MKRKPKKTNGTLWLDDGVKAATRMQAIQVAAHLPESEPSGHGMMSSSYMRPGKTAEKVVADAEKIMAFITKA